MIASHTFDLSKHAARPDFPNQQSPWTPPAPVYVCNKLPSCKDQMLTTPVGPLPQPVR